MDNSLLIRCKSTRNIATCYGCLLNFLQEMKKDQPVATFHGRMLDVYDETNSDWLLIALNLPTLLPSPVPAVLLSHHKQAKKII